MIQFSLILIFEKIPKACGKQFNKRNYLSFAKTHFHIVNTSLFVFSSLYFWQIDENFVFPFSHNLDLNSAISKHLTPKLSTDSSLY
jgi:hypothetical protein